MKRRDLRYYQAAVEVLEGIKKSNEALQFKVPQFALPMKPINEKLAKAREALARMEASEGVE